jgi:stage II sporulation protein P
MLSKFLKYLFLLALLILVFLAGTGKEEIARENPAIYALTEEKPLIPVLDNDSTGKRENGEYPFAETLLNELEDEEITGEKYFRLVDKEGRIITITGRRIRPGDRYLDEKNRLYEVYRVRDYVATARYIRTEKLKKPGRTGSSFLWEKNKGILNLLQQAFNSAGERGNNGEEAPRKLVALYHTHNAESYVPSDGTYSIYGRGGIHQVGAALKDALEEKNIDVIHSENLHLPHDRGAYRRSRNTALNLLQQNPDVIFDVHRDAAPRDAYAVQVNDQWVTRIQFVVGRQNPSTVVTRRFAYDLKGLTDEVYPGLIKGVFMGWGNYNQDLTPLNLLLEVGSHENSKDAAEESMTLFADVVAKYFYGIPVGEEEGVFPRADEPGAAGGTVGGTIAVIILLVAAALGGFYFLNNPGAWERFKEQIKLYLGRNGLVWKEGYHNLVLSGKRILSGLRTVLVYLLILGQLLQDLFRRIRRRLKKGLK